MKTKSVTIISGGMDSAVLAHMLHAQDVEQLCLSFDYGQRHKKELEYAARMAYSLHASHRIIDLTDLHSLIRTSALTGQQDVPDGHYNEDSMRITVVPNRNAIMLTIAFAAASSWGASLVSTGVHSGDRYNYPDCREEFTRAFQKMQEEALAGFCIPNLYTPFIEQTKADIAKKGKSLNVDFSQTWSCYKGKAKHCGVCGTCVERLEALHEAGVEDTTEYEDKHSWKKIVDEYATNKTK